MKYKLWAAGGLLLSLLILGGCGKERPQRNYYGAQNGTGSTATGVAAEFDTQILGVVKAHDGEADAVTLLDVNAGQDVTLPYSGGSDVRDQYDQVISMSQLKPGEIVEAFYSNSLGRLVKLQISKEAWDYQGIDRLDINKTTKVMQIAERRYRYDGNLVVTDGKSLLSLIDINNKDELTARGIGGTIYSLTVTRGHGYIRFRNYDAFIGGYAEAGRDVFATVTENMLLVVREGQYEVSLRKGELVGRKTVTVGADQEVILDMREYQPKPDRIGQIEFLISPEGADLYVNETLTDYEEPVELNYGKYDIRVSMAGYEDWTGFLTVGSAYTPIEISLAVKKAETPGAKETPNITIEGENGKGGAALTLSPSPTAAPTASPGNGDGTTLTESETDGTGETEEKPVTVDANHMITISTPTMAEVYVNGQYKGTSPVSFPKQIGDLTITLCRDGYQSRSYTITVEDDKKDKKLDLMELTKVNG